MSDISAETRAAAHLELADMMRAGLDVDFGETGKKLAAGAIAATLATTSFIAPTSQAEAASHAPPAHTQQALLADQCVSADLDRMSDMLRVHNHYGDEYAQQRTQIITDLGASETGRSLLEAADRNDTLIAVIPGEYIAPPYQQIAGKFVPQLNAVFVAAGDRFGDQTGTLGHELEHARQFHDGGYGMHLTSPEVAQMPKSEFLENTYKSEADAFAKEVRINQELAAQGNTAPRDGLLALSTSGAMDWAKPLIAAGEELADVPADDAIKSLSGIAKAALQSDESIYPAFAGMRHDYLSGCAERLGLIEQSASPAKLADIPRNEERRAERVDHLLEQLKVARAPQHQVLPASLKNGGFDR